MFFSKEKDKSVRHHIKGFFKSKAFQRVTMGIVTLFIVTAILVNGASPQKYNLYVGEVSKYDITATRDIENKSKTEQNARAAFNDVTPAMTEIKGASIDVLNNLDSFLTVIDSARESVVKSLENQGYSKKDKNYKKQLVIEQAFAIAKLSKESDKLGITLSPEKANYLVAKTTDEEISRFKAVTKNLVSESMKHDITMDNLDKEIVSLSKSFDNTDLSQSFKEIGQLLAKVPILKPNKTIDTQQTDLKRQKAYDDIINNKKVIIKKGERVVSVGDSIGLEQMGILEDLNLLQENQIDFALISGIFMILLLLSILLVLYMNHFCKKILYNRKDLLMLSVVIVLVVLVAWWTNTFSPLAIPILIAAMLISILLDMKLALMVNFILTIAISFITKGDMSFIYVSMISGTFAAFLVSKATQRNKLFMSGVFIAVINVLVVFSYGIINRQDISDILRNSEIVALNGIVSVIITIGMLPFWESAFNLITPLKLLELANPNQPLLKRLLMEAPGTYHHSLMVGNLAEVGADAIGANALLARVGAYFHDIGKLKRPNFFKENQLSDNPHDRMTANLSTLVITSHTRDGVELAKKYKIPHAIKEIISQHHGTTLVAYFYHKAKKGEKGEEIRPENFRYEGPKPTSREAAVVLLADSVEAAVRSMVDKTEGKIEGLVRKIIKDKLDDGQLDLCNLTLKNLDDIANGFMKVLSGFFHAREEYPEVKIQQTPVADPKVREAAGESVLSEKVGEEYFTNGNIN